MEDLEISHSLRASDDGMLSFKSIKPEYGTAVITPLEMSMSRSGGLGSPPDANFLLMQYLSRQQALA